MSPNTIRKSRHCTLEMTTSGLRSGIVSNQSCHSQDTEKTWISSTESFETKVCLYQSNNGGSTTGIMLPQPRQNSFRKLSFKAFKGEHTTVN